MRVKELRIERNLSQQQLADASGVYREDISRIENGKKTLYIDTAVKLADALGCSLDELVGREDPTEETEVNGNG